MKKYIFILFLMLFQVVNAAEKEVIIFSQPCHFCEIMKEDLDNGIIEANPDIKFTILDIRDEKNAQKLRELATKHRLRGDVGTPLLFIGKNYMMGWGPNAKENLQEYINEMRNEAPEQSVVFKKDFK